MIPQAEPPRFTDYASTGDQAGLLARLWPTGAFYGKITRTVLASSWLARRGRFDDAAWYRASLRVREIFEQSGSRFQVEGTAHLAGLDGPAVIIGNHMSTAETFLLGAILLPFRPVTFVVKQSLVEYPVFKHIMRSRDPVVVGRVDPRADLKAVLDGGKDRLSRGLSLVIFPQRTRTVTFDRSAFNTIGVKVARKNAAPVVPLALKTNAWSNGSWFKDYGPFRPEEAVRFAFGPPMRVDGNDREVHEAVAGFIETRLREWGVPVV